MILNKNFLNTIEKAFKDDIQSEHQVIETPNYQIEFTVIPADDNTVIIKAVKEENKDKEKLNDFISKFSESQFQLLMDTFQEVTGKSLSTINDCYRQGRYDEVYQLLQLVLKYNIEKLQEFLH